MKRKNIIIILILALLFSFTSTTIVFASEPIENDLVSVEEYTEAIKNAFEKYGGKLEVLDTSNYTPIPREVLELIVKNIEEAGKARLEANLEAERRYKSLLKENSLNDISGSENIPFSTMPRELLHQNDRRIEAKMSGALFPFGYALVRYSAYATYDMNRELYMSVSPNGAFIKEAVNYDSHKFTREEWKTINGGRILTVYIEGTITFVWDEPYGGSELRSTEPVAIFDDFEGPYSDKRIIY